MMIDLHTHILCSADDGAADEAVTRQMLSRCREQKILTIAATAHSEQCPPEQYDRLYAEVSKIAAEYGIRLLSGMEYLYGELSETPADKLHPVAGKNCLLLDLRRIYPDSVICRNLYKLTSHGFRILLAHPERLWGSGECLSVIRQLTENPYVYCQLNAGSILGVYGTSPRLCAWKLLEAGYCAVIASDAHKPERLILPECRKKLLQVYPETLVSLWMDQNPERVLAGEPLLLRKADTGIFAKMRRTWQYWR